MPEWQRSNPCRWCRRPAQPESYVPDAPAPKAVRACALDRICATASRPTRGPTRTSARLRFHRTSVAGRSSLVVRALGKASFFALRPSGHIQGSKSGLRFRLSLIRRWLPQVKVLPANPEQQYQRYLDRQRRGLPTTNDASSSLHHEFQRPREIWFQFLARDHGIEHSVFQEKLGALEPWRQLLPDRLLNHSRSCEANQRARFGDIEIAQHGKRCGHATGGGIGQNRNVRNPRRV